MLTSIPSPEIRSWIIVIVIEAMIVIILVVLTSGSGCDIHMVIL